MTLIALLDLTLRPEAIADAPRGAARDARGHPRVPGLPGRRGPTRVIR